VSTLLFVSYSGVFGGAERVLIDCADAIEGEHLLVCPEGELAARARAAGLRVLVVTARGLDLRAGPRARALAAKGLLDHGRELRRLALDLDPDLIVAWGMRSAIACLLAAPGRPFAFAHHDFLPGPLIGTAVRAAAARAAVVITPSRAVAGDLDRRGRLGERLHVVHPGVDVDELADAGPPADPPEVLVLGALTAWKRPDLALEICALARRRRPELRVCLVGAPVTAADGTLARLRERAAAPDLVGAVQLAGARADPGPELHRATCLLHCAEREPFGIVLLEAMAAARPVIAADAAGPREILDRSCAWLYPPGDAEAGAAALVALLADPERARAAGLAGRERVRARFARSRTRAGFAAAVAPLLREPGAPGLRADQLTLVTVTHDSAGELPALLDSVQRHLPGAAMVVVDCASRDRSVELARLRPWVTVVELAENVGFGRACNRGLDAVRAPVTALVNPDVELLDNSLLRLAAQAQHGDCPERLLAPLVLNGDGSRQDTAHPAPGSAADLIAALVPPSLVPGRAGAALAPWRADAPRRTGWAVGCALVARTSTLRRLGPFDESIFMFAEDLELGLRARQQGVETWFWPSGRVVHRGAHSTRAAFGGEPFALLARARHDAVSRRLGPRRAALDDGAQMVTFASRLVLKRMLGRPTTREHRQLEAVSALRRGAPGAGRPR
jgi:N-acetylglucosaminyl-diphospho-decaprenol L-rhamnosyltransferase